MQRDRPRSCAIINERYNRTNRGSISQSGSSRDDTHSGHSIEAMHREEVLGRETDHILAQVSTSAITGRTEDPYPSQAVPEMTHGSL